MKIHWRRDRLPTPVFLVLGFPCGSAGKESTCNAGDLGLIPGLGRCPGEGKGFQYSGLENSMDSRVHGVAVRHDWATFTSLKSSYFPHLLMQEMQEMQVWFLGPEDPLKEGMTTHFNILAWRIPWTEESGGEQSIGSQRVGHDGSDLV